MERVSNYKSLKSRSGFTLVELLVVISIIGILSSFAVVSLNIARIKARNALRKGDMAQIRTALNVYYDIHERYPICSDDWDTDLENYGAGNGCYNIELADALSAGARPLVNQLPKDPKNDDNLTKDEDADTGHDEFIYKYVSDGEGEEYVITYRLEEETEDEIFRGR